MSAAHPLRVWSSRVAGWLGRRAARGVPRGRASISSGRDFAQRRAARPALSRALPALLAGVVLAALALAALRVDLIRVRYGLGQAMREEKAAARAGAARCGRGSAACATRSASRASRPATGSRAPRACSISPSAPAADPRP